MPFDRRPCKRTGYAIVATRQKSPPEGCRLRFVNELRVRHMQQSATSTDPRNSSKRGGRTPVNLCCASPQKSPLRPGLHSQPHRVGRVIGRRCESMSSVSLHSLISRGVSQVDVCQGETKVLSRPETAQQSLLERRPVGHIMGDEQLARSSPHMSPANGRRTMLHIWPVSSVILWSGLSEGSRTGRRHDRPTWRVSRVYNRSPPSARNIIVVYLTTRQEQKKAAEAR
jgi:hypothetical protein